MKSLVSLRGTRSDEWVRRGWGVVHNVSVDLCDAVPVLV